MTSRIKSVVVRSKDKGLDYKNILTKVASFGSVEHFQVWRKILLSKNHDIGFAVELVGGNNYREIRDNLDRVLKEAESIHEGLK
jgi:hypothetical protein